jgi:iron-sulfur cluster assembly protein
MINVSSSAAKQIMNSIEQSDTAKSPLRIAIQEQKDGSFHYAMGFDDQRLPGDVFINIEDISLVVSAQSKDLAEGMTIDYAELEPGSHEFIFLNPNDPTYIAPKNN